jgi:DNA-binding beta-propeller fold protein YncE
MTIRQLHRMCFAAIATVPLWAVCAFAQAPLPAPLQLEGKILLGEVRGRIDHLAIDLSRKRLFVAELENDTVGVVDLNERKVRHRIDGLKEPQGVGYLPASDTLYVANAGDGSVRLFRGESHVAAGRIDLGDDADNIRVDAGANRVFVGYGNGALAVIDPATNAKIADMPLPVHPESFQLARSDGHVFVNVPRARGVAVFDRATGKQTASWAIESDSHFPMALDESSGRVLVVSRNPARLRALSMRDGSTVATFDACGDADDLFVDARRRRVYISCGDGNLDVLEMNENSYRRAARIPTISGARTSLFVPEIDRLFIAARANPGEPAAIWVFRPTP